MTEAIKSLVDYVKDHAIEDELKHYQIFEIYRHQILEDSKQHNFLITQVPDIVSRHIYIATPTPELIKFFTNYLSGEYELRIFSDERFLQLAKYFIDRGFTLFNAKFMGEQSLISFSVKREDVHLAFYKSGMFYANVAPMKHIQPYFHQFQDVRR